MDVREPIGACCILDEYKIMSVLMCRNRETITQFILLWLCVCGGGGGGGVGGGISILLL